jgi:hypothetical protein
MKDRRDSPTSAAVRSRVVADAPEPLSAREDPRDATISRLRAYDLPIKPLVAHRVTRHLCPNHGETLMRLLQSGSYRRSNLSSRPHLPSPVVPLGKCPHDQAHNIDCLR